MKLKLTVNKARVLIFLDNTNKIYHYPTGMSRKLNISYTYLQNILGQLVEIKLLERYRLDNKVFYKLTHVVPIQVIGEFLASRETTREVEIKTGG